MVIFFAKKITIPSQNSDIMVNSWTTVCCREAIFLIQIFFSDQIMFWSFEFFGRDWLLHIILILKSMKSMVFVVRCRESIVLIQIFFCNQIMFWSFILYGRDWLLHRILMTIIDLLDFIINIICSNQSRPKNSKLQNIIWSEKKSGSKALILDNKRSKTNHSQIDSLM